MPTLSSEVRRKITVTDSTGAPVTGLTGSAFTPTLRLKQGSTLSAATEAVTFSEIGGGDYWAIFTPTAAATLYVLDVKPVSASYIIEEGDFQIDVEAAPATTSGPYLTTLAAFKTAWNVTGTNLDAAISNLLGQVTKFIQRETGRTLFAQTGITEYPPIPANVLERVLVNEAPISAITSIHISTSWPRIYDSTTLLVAGTDYDFDGDRGVIEFAETRWGRIYGSAHKALRVIYNGGFDPVPGDLERAAQEIIGVKLYKGTGKYYPYLNVTREDGSIAGIRFDDIPPSSQAVIENYRRAVVL